MTTLDAETTAPPEPAAPEAGAPPAARTCPTCSAAMAPDQDWCLECGTAAPGRLGARPGWRAASTVVGLTLLLVLGAVAASYAALSGDAAQVATRPPAPSVAPVPQAPPAVPPAEAPAPTTEAPLDDLPEVDPPASSGGDVDDPVDLEPIDPGPVDPGPSAGAGTGSGTGSGSSGTGSSSGGGDDAEDEGDAGAEDAGPVAIDLPATAGSLLDPYGNAQESNEAARALDGKAGTSWFASAAEDARSLGFGYAIALEDPADVRELLLTTKTPGFRVEVYGTTSRELPPDVLDQRWIHLRDRSDVDASVGGAPKDGNVNGDGEERIDLGDNAEGKRLRHVLLWFTLPPENGPTIRLTEVELRA